VIEFSSKRKRKKKKKEKKEGQSRRADREYIDTDHKSLHQCKQ
jgi:hypothetical protein